MKNLIDKRAEKYSAKLFNQLSSESNRLKELMAYKY